MKRTNTIWFEGHNLQKMAEAQHFSLRRVAAACGVPVRKLRAFLKAETSMHARMWMRNAFATRVTALQKRKVPLAKIAALLGFRDLGHFSRAFYVARGYPPSENLARLAGSGKPVTRVRHRAVGAIAKRLEEIHDWDHLADIFHYSSFEVARNLQAESLLKKGLNNKEVAASRKVNNLSEEFMTREAQNLQDRWPNMSEEERRRFVENFVIDLTVGAGEVSISLCRLPAFEQMTERQRTVWCALPLCHGSIVAPRPLHPHRWKCTQTASLQPDTIGEHIKARRLALHRFQSDVAKEFGVDKGSIQNWERGVFQPVPRYYPSIIRFLGYVPFEHDGTRGGCTRWLRICAGWSQEELSAVVGCEECTIWRWETNQPFDPRRWSRGIAAMADRLAKLGLTELTADVSTDLLKG